MIRSVNSNFVSDYAVLKYPNLFKRIELALSDEHGFYYVHCLVCVDFIPFKNCKEVESHVEIHVYEGYEQYCGH